MSEFASHSQKNESGAAARGGLVARIFARYNEALVRYLSGKLKSEASAREVAQEAYIRLIGVEHLEEVQNHRAYLYKTASNLALERLKKRRRGLVDVNSEAVESLEIECTRPSPENIAYQRSRVRHLMTALDELPPKCARVFVMHRCADMTYAEVGRACAISESMVKKYIIKALAHCRERMKPYD